MTEYGVPSKDILPFPLFMIFKAVSNENNFHGSVSNVMTVFLKFSRCINTRKWHQLLISWLMAIEYNIQKLFYSSRKGYAHWCTVYVVCRCWYLILTHEFWHFCDTFPWLAIAKAQSCTILYSIDLWHLVIYWKAL